MDLREDIFNSDSVAEKIRAMMESHGIPRRRQSKELTVILNLSFSQAHRKLTGASPWTLDQLKRITEYFNDQSLGATLNTPAPAGASFDAHDAVLVAGDQKLSCVAWIGEVLDIPHPAEFVAVRRGEEWHIVNSRASRNDGETCRRVGKIEVHVQQAQLPRIAVVDDDHNLADSLRDYLNEAGFDASAFYSREALELAMEDTAFDGFVIDWLLGASTTEPLIRAIRLDEQSNVPIIVLTGQLVTGRASESDVARVIMQFNIICREKPTRLSIIAAELHNAIKLPRGPAIEIQGADKARAALAGPA